MEAIIEEPVVNLTIWNAWLERGRQSDLSTARMMKVVGGIVVLLVVGGAAYFLAGK